MNVSSYLEAFLTVYGWDMYYMFYLLLGALGFYLYPVARVLIDIYQNFVSGSEYSGTNYMRQFIASMVSIFLVFLVALVPVKSLTLAKTTVKSVCAERSDVGVYNSDGKGGKYFESISTRAPIAPWFAMSLGQGLNAVTYSSATCALDVTETRKAMMNVSLDNAENPELLKSELQRFVNECHQPAVSMINRIRDGGYGKPATEWMKSQVESLVTSTGKSEKVLLGFYDSSFIKNTLYSPSSPMTSVTGVETIPGSFVAKEAVPGYTGYETGNSQQGISGAPPSCHDWWTNGSGSTTALRTRIAGALSDSAVEQTGSLLGVGECRPDVYVRARDTVGTSEKPGWTMSAGRRSTCRNKIVSDLYNGNGDHYVEALLRNQQGSGLSDNVISSSDSATLGWGVTAGVAAGIISKITGVNLGVGNVVGQLTGFYVTLYLLKLLLQYLIPFILMTIYMFWGVYMVIGEFKGMTMIRGMILITALTIMPGLWAIIGHLDDKLYSAMYDGVSDTSKFNMLLLDIATSIFQIAIVFVVFFLISEAGSTNASGAVNPGQASMNKAAGGTGGSIGGSAGKTGAWGMAGAKSQKTGNWSGDFPSKIGRTAKGWVNKMRGK